MANVSRVITLSPVGAELAGLNYAPVIMGLAGDSTYGPLSASGGWQVVDRPKNVAATQWYDRSVYKLTFKAILDKENLNYAFAGASVEDDCYQLESWVNKTPHSQEPPKLTIDGPIPDSATGKLWVVFDLQFNEAHRAFNTTGNSGNGYRTQQNVDITLYEYVPPISTSLTNLLSSSALRFQTTAAPNAALQPTMSLCVIVAGDTLTGIVNRVAGIATSDFLAFVREINGIRDDSMIANMVGRVLQIPRSTV